MKFESPPPESGKLKIFARTANGGEQHSSQFDPTATFKEVRERFESLFGTTIKKVDVIEPAELVFPNVPETTKIADLRFREDEKPAKLVIIVHFI